MRLRSALRSASPYWLRVTVALALREWRDSSFVGARLRMAKRKLVRADADFPHLVAKVAQVIRSGAFAEGKLANIRLGAKLLDGVVVAPGETLSFWKLVGRPSTAAGFRLGRSIRRDVVGGEIGGGLCQVSGIAYEVGLRAGMEVVSRHPHSRDLYTDEDRFTPLGLDATVVWPYKDLRLANRLPVPVQFRFEVRDAAIAASVHAPVPLEPSELEITRVDHDHRRDVRVVRKGADRQTQLISEDSYLGMAGPLA